MISGEGDKIKRGLGFGTWEPDGPVPRQVGRFRGPPPTSGSPGAVPCPWASVLGKPGRTAASSPQPDTLGICSSMSGDSGTPWLAWDVATRSWDIPATRFV